MKKLLKRWKKQLKNWLSTFAMTTARQMHVVSLTEKQAMSVVMTAIAKTMAMITAMREKLKLKPLKKGSFTSLAIIKKGDLVIIQGDVFKCTPAANHL